MCLSEISSGMNIIEKGKDFFVCVREKIRNEGKKQELDKGHTSEFPYYFEDYTKHVTIYKNGNGIIINSSTLVVTDLSKFSKIYRKLNIEDGKKSSNFSKLEEMLQQDKSQRFEKFGFWFYSDNDIIESAKEFYWSDTDKSKEDKRIKGNSKELRWFFEFNKSRIKENEPYRIIYVISIKGMYPIENGVIKQEEINDVNSLDVNSSEIDIIQNINNFKYIVSFEDGIDLERAPKCEVCKQRYTDGENIAIPEEKEYNVLFNKYTFKVDKPILGTRIKTFWKFKPN